MLLISKIITNQSKIETKQFIQVIFKVSLKLKKIKVFDLIMGRFIRGIGLNKITTASNCTWASGIGIEFLNED